MHRFPAVMTLLAAMLCIAPACADLPSTPAPAAAASYSSSGGQPDLSRLAVFRKAPNITIAWAKAWIGPQGGRLDFYGFAIDVPAGAVDKPTMFTINLPVDPKSAEHVVAEFGPHNVAFLKPVRIELPYTGTSIEGAANPEIVWWSPDDTWVNMGGVITPDGARLQVDVPHFSTYGTSDETQRTTGVAVSGG